VTAEDFTASADRLLNQIDHWEQSRWSRPAPGVAASSSPAAVPASSAASGVAASAAAAVPAASSRVADGTAVLTRADVVHVLLQHLADLAADAEGNAHRPVPRPSVLTLPDQLRVLADDLTAAPASAEALKSATDLVNATRQAL
jgi:hypothetical protein